MNFPDIYAIGPIDGRYHRQTESLSAFFSECALMKYRVKVELEYFIALTQKRLPQLPALSKTNIVALRKIVEKFSEKDAREIKEIEKKTNHDVKAVEYFLRNRFDKIKLGKYKEFIHFGLTSQDINNTALPMMIRDALNMRILPLLLDVTETMEACATQWNEIPMLAHTHGQPASPTKAGKEFRVFTERLREQISLIGAIPFTCKFGGATGNFNAHHVAYPRVDWKKFADDFCEKQLHLKRQQTTTQIEHYDHLAALFDNLKRINTILIDFCRDLWMYISMDYFRQKITKSETGSSAMPHKVNPIDFENAEGNLGIANALFGFLSAKLPVSRMQRDLTDSTVTRNIGVPFAHTVIALNSVKKGLGKLMLNRDAMDADLEKNWAVVSEGIQTILRRESYKDPYGALKELTRTHKKMDRKQFETFIDSLDVPDKVKAELKKITPWNYTGLV